MDTLWRENRTPGDLAHAIREALIREPRLRAETLEVRIDEIAPTVDQRLTGVEIMAEMIADPPTFRCNSMPRWTPRRQDRHETHAGRRMKKAFRDAYERELDMLYERSAEFAEEFRAWPSVLAACCAKTSTHHRRPAGGHGVSGGALQLKLDEGISQLHQRAAGTDLSRRAGPGASCMMVEAPPLTRQTGDGEPQGSFSAANIWMRGFAMPTSV